MNVADADEISTLEALISSFKGDILVIKGKILVTEGEILVMKNTRKQRIITDQEQSELVALDNKETALFNNLSAPYSKQTAYTNQKVKLLKR
jgi:hypothetical protein